MKKKTPKVSVIDLTEMVKEHREKLSGTSFADMLEKVVGESMPQEVRDRIGELVDGKAQVRSVAQNQAELAEYFAAKELAVGDFVEPNKYGKKRYTETENEAGLVVDVWDGYRSAGIIDDEMVLANGVVAFCGKGGMVRVYAVDLRMYSKVDIAKGEAKH